MPGHPKAHPRAGSQCLPWTGLNWFFCSLPAATAAVYKQWIPNTNFETASNWDKGRVPCARDVVHFEKDKVQTFNFIFVDTKQCQVWKSPFT